MRLILFLPRLRYWESGFFGFSISTNSILPLINSSPICGRFQNPKLKPDLKVPIEQLARLKNFQNSYFSDRALSRDFIARFSKRRFNDNRRRNSATAVNFDSIITPLPLLSESWVNPSISATAKLNQKFVYSLSGLGRNRLPRNIAETFQQNSGLRQFLFYPLNIGRWLINLLTATTKAFHFSVKFQSPLWSGV